MFFKKKGIMEDEQILCDCCEKNPVKLVCNDCFQGMWCSEECHQKDAADHEEYFCYHPEDMSDECVLEHVEYETHDPNEARAIMKEMIGEDILIGISPRRRQLRRRKRKVGRRKRRLRRQRLKEKRRVRKERREDRLTEKERRRLRREKKKLRAEERKRMPVEVLPAVRDDEEGLDTFEEGDLDLEAANIAAFFSNSRVF